jgi:hypothetical protein
MSQSGNGEWPDCGKPKGAFTGQRLARERPKVYRQVIALLAQGTSDSSIAKLMFCRVYMAARRLGPTVVHAV